jgi:hypothetical protein
MSTIEIPNTLIIKVLLNVTEFLMVNMMRGTETAPHNKEI